PIDLSCCFWHYCPELLVAARVTTMFLRSSVVKKGGKTYRYWKLVENVRTDTGPRQQVVAHLGDLSNFTAADWQALAGRMGEPEMAAALQRRVRQGGRQGRPPKWTIEDHSASTSDASDLVSIRLSETSWREPVAFGDVYTALVLWKRLGLGELLGERMDGSAAKIPWRPPCRTRRWRAAAISDSPMRPARACQSAAVKLERSPKWATTCCRGPVSVRTFSTSFQRSEERRVGKE